MRCRDTRWDKRIEQTPQSPKTPINKELQDKLKAMEEERKQQDIMWTSHSTTESTTESTSETTTESKKIKRK